MGLSVSVQAARRGCLHAYVSLKTDVPAFVTDILQERLPNFKHIGVLPPGRGRFDRTEADLHPLLDIRVRERLAVCGVVIAGDIRDGHERLAVMLDEQVLILEIDHPLPIVRLNVDLTIVEALGLQILSLDDLTPCQEAALHADLLQILKSIAAVLRAGTQLVADLLAERDRPARKAVFDVRLLNHPAGQTRDLAEGRTNPAADLLAHGRVLRIFQRDIDLVVLVVCHRKRRRIESIDVQQQRVQRGYGAACTVAVNERDVVEQRDQHRTEGVEAAELHGDGVFQLARRIHYGRRVPERVEGIDGILGEIHFLQSCRRAHAGRDRCVGVRIHLRRVVQRQLHRLFRVELLVGFEQIRAADHCAAATAAHERGAPNHIDKLLFVQNPFRHFPLPPEYFFVYDVSSIASDTKHSGNRQKSNRFGGQRCGGIVVLKYKRQSGSSPPCRGFNSAADARPPPDRFQSSPGAGSDRSPECCGFY